MKSTRQILIIPLDRLERQLAVPIQALKAYGIGIQGLVAYSVHAATASDYNNLVSYLLHDLLGERPDLREQLSVIHTCIDFIGASGAIVAEMIRQMCGYFDHTAALDGFFGSDAIISIQLPE